MKKKFIIAGTILVLITAILFGTIKMIGMPKETHTDNNTKTVTENVDDKSSVDTPIQTKDDSEEIKVNKPDEPKPLVDKKPEDAIKENNSNDEETSTKDKPSKEESPKVIVRVEKDKNTSDNQQNKRPVEKDSNYIKDKEDQKGTIKPIVKEPTSKQPKPVDKPVKPIVEKPVEEKPVNPVEEKPIEEKPVVEEPIDDKTPDDDKVVDKEPEIIITKKEYHKDSEIPFKTEIIKSAELLLGKEEKTPGVVGLLREFFEMVLHNDKVVETNKVGEKILKEAIAEKIIKGTREITTKEITKEIPYKTEHKKSSDLLVGQQKVQKGTPGQKIELYEIHSSEGKVIKEELIETKIKVEPINEIIFTGTKEVELSETFENIPFQKITKESAELEKGQTQVIKGEPGQKKIITEITYIEGKEVSRKIKDTIIVKEPVNEITLVGTKEPSEVENKEVKIESRTEIVPYQLETQKSSDMMVGDQKVIPGANGELTIKEEVVYINGVEQSRTEISRVQTKAPVNQITIIGTKEIKVIEEKDIIKSPKITKEDPTLPLGETKFIPGYDGYVLKKIEVTYIEGKEVSRKVIENVLHPPTDTITIVGTKLPDTETRSADSIVYLTIGEKYQGQKIIDINNDYGTLTYKEINALDDEKLYQEAKNDDNLAYYITETEDKMYRNMLPTNPSPEVVKNLNTGIQYFDEMKFNQEFLKLVNQERASKGIAPMKISETLKRAANVRSTELAEHGHIRFMSPDGKVLSHVRDANGTSWSTVFTPEERAKLGAIGENLAMNFIQNPYGQVSEKYIAEVFFNQWKNSSGHYANMMRPYFTEHYVSIKFTTRTLKADLVTPTENWFGAIATELFNGN